MVGIAEGLCKWPEYSAEFIHKTLHIAEGLCKWPEYSAEFIHKTLHIAVGIWVSGMKHSPRGASTT